MTRICLTRKFIYSGNLILVNARYPYREQPDARERMPVFSGTEEVLLDREAAKALAKLLERVEGREQIVAVSGWRSLREQQELYDDSLKENGKEFTAKFVALPGHSEHHTGLAIDLALKREEIDPICPDFPYTGICRTFRENAAFYGFVERYPAGKEAVTGIAQEPWHFRYVGTPHAEIMAEHGFALEEYISFLKSYPYGKTPYVYCGQSGEAKISYLKAAGDRTFLEAAEGACLISGNNADGFILTERRG